LLTQILPSETRSGSGSGRQHGVDTPSRATASGGSPRSGANAGSGGEKTPAEAASTGSGRAGSCASASDDSRGLERLMLSIAGADR